MAQLFPPPKGLSYFNFLFSRVEATESLLRGRGGGLVPPVQLKALRFSLAEYDGVVVLAVAGIRLGQDKLNSA